MSWAQVNGATTDSEFKNMTDEGSIAFLTGASRVQEAMRLLDQGKPMEAAATGLMSVNDFSSAQFRFETASQYLQEQWTAARELRIHLKNVKLDKRASTLKLSGGEGSPVWIHVKDVLQKQGAIGLFANAAQYPAAIGKGSDAFFHELKDTGKYAPIRQASLMVQLAEALMYGACVSALFAGE